MRLIIIGCEYTGKTTLAAGIKQWLEQCMGHCATSFHDHFLPWDPEDAGPKGDRIEEDLKLLTLNDSRLMGKYMRYVIHYHTHPNFYAKPDHCVVNWYYGDAIYGPLYYGFGGPGESADRQVMARSCDAMVMQDAPDTTLVLVKADADVLRRRRRDAARPKPYPLEEDIELVLEQFEEEFRRSLIRRRIVLDTSSTEAPETLEQFVAQIQQYLEPADHLRMLTHQQG